MGDVVADEAARLAALREAVVRTVAELFGRGPVAPVATRIDGTVRAPARVQERLPASVIGGRG